MKTCDACEETWEDSFFCAECSGEMHLETVERPVLMWDGYGPDTKEVEEFVPNGNICLNCCTYHYRNAIEAFRDRLPDKPDWEVDPLSF